jgi:hypothetical protein
MTYNLSSIKLPNAVSEKLLDIEVVFNEKEKSYTLYQNNEKWMIFSTSKEYDSVKEFYSQYDQAYGDVLITGLGFGIVASWLLQKKSVKSVTVVELSKEIIELFKKNNSEIYKNLTIINQDASKYITNKKYDCLFLDHYEDQDFSWRLNDINLVMKNIPHDIFWSWSIEELYTWKEYGFYRKHKDYDKNYKKLFYNKNDFSDKWEKFIKDNFIKHGSFNVSKDNLNEYIYLYYQQEKYYVDKKGATPYNI